MPKLFFKKLNEKLSFSPQEEEILKGLLCIKKLRKKQYLLQAGEACKLLTFVEEGALRAYSVDEKGQEHIMRFALEGETISDLNSFMTGEPSAYHIDALEDTEIVGITKGAWQSIQLLVPKYEMYIRQELTTAYSAMQQRITALISLPPQEAYNYFIALHPTIAQRVPQHMIASYLGLTPETLSRVRKRLFAGR